MTRARVPLYGKPQGYVIVDADATNGAVMGENVFNPDGSLFEIPPPVVDTSEIDLKLHLSDLDRLRLAEEQFRLEQDLAQERIDRALEISGIAGAGPYDPEVVTPAGTVVRTDDAMYKALVEVPVQTPPPDPDYWLRIGTVAEGVLAVSDLSARVDEVDGVLSTYGQRLDLVEVDVAGKASAEALSLLSGEVEQIGEDVAANAAAILQVSAEVEGPFTAAHGWQFVTNHNGFTAVNASLVYRPPTVDFGASIIEAYGDNPDFYSPDFSVPGQTSPIVRAMVMRMDSSPWEGFLFWKTTAHGFSGSYTKNGSVVPPVGEWTVVEWDMSDNEDWRSSTITGLRFDFGAVNGSTIAVRWIVIGDNGPGLAASVLQSFTANAGPGGAFAQATVMTDVNGRIGGLRMTNDGTVTDFVVLADTAEFISEDGSFQIAGGRTIIRSNGYMRVEGKPFGQGNEMVMWYGPQQSTLADCRRSNAISFETNTGVHYSLGAMFSGTITAGGQTRALLANTYTTGPFGTNGNPIVVNASFAHYREQVGGRSITGKNTIAEGSGTTTATIQLWRKIGSGNFEMVAATSAPGSLSIDRYPDDPEIDDRAYWSNVVSLSYTDNEGGIADREYEVRVVSEIYQGVLITGGHPVPAPTNTRLLGVLTSE